MHHADNFDTGVDAGSHDTALKRAEPGRPGRGRVRSLARRGLAGLLAALVALPLQAQAQTDAINTFTAPANATLEKETDYFVVFEETETGSDTGYRLKQTTSD